MIRLKRPIFLILFLCLTLISIPLCGHAEVNSKLYPLPITELEQLLFRWLTRSGFDVCRTALKMGQIQLDALKVKEKWEIFLRPHSPLATEIQARCTIGGQPDEARLKRLWDFISGYTKAPLVEREDSNQVIPNAVLSEIESVVCITGKHDHKDMQLSGFIVDEEGLIICTAHDVRSAQEITVILNDGRRFKGHLVQIDVRRDLALLRINLKPNNFISLAKGRNLLDMGERLYAIGCPINRGGTIVSGIINGPPRRANDMPLWQVNMEVLPGSSGSPVFDEQGNLVALVKGRYRGRDSVGFLIPLETIIEFLKQK